MRLEAKQISAGYHGASVLHGIDISAESGELVGLIGPNGCGKSTLLRVLSHVLAPTGGSVSIGGQPIAQLTRREIARLIAFVPQDEPAAFEFSVRDVVMMGRYPHQPVNRGPDENDYRRVEQALADVDLLGLADRPITELSGGEQRRVLLARALAQSAPVLLLDEPTSHLDIAHQAELLMLVRELVTDRRVAAIAVLHDLNVAAEYCDRLVLMRDGATVAEGEPDTVLTSPNLRRAYDADTLLARNPATDRPLILSVQPARDAGADSAPFAVHVVCGGGSGAAILSALVRSGATVSAGVLNRLDRDHDAATALGIELVEEQPFSPIGTAARSECAELMARSDIVLIAPVPFGRGNLASLELAVEAQRAGSTVVIIGARAIGSRDYTNGAAAALVERLLAGGAYSMDRFDIRSLPVPAQAEIEARTSPSKETI